MKYNVFLLNCIKFKNKNGREQLVINYVFDNKESYQENQSYKGYSTNYFYHDDVHLLEELKNKDFLAPCILEIVEVPSKKNPLRNVRKVSKLTFGDSSINLV